MPPPIYPRIPLQTIISGLSAARPGMRKKKPMIVVMAASGSAEVVRSPKQIWCFSAADARRATTELVAQYGAEDEIEVFSVDFPEVSAAALRNRTWRKTAEDCTRMALAMYLKHQQTALEPREEWQGSHTVGPLRRAA